MSGLIRRLTLACAFGLPAPVTAAGAGLPGRMAAPARTAAVCDIYGRGFYAIPGGRACLRLGGRVRFELNVRNSHGAWQPVPGGGGTFASARRQDLLGWRARADLTFETRAWTGFATLHTVIAIAMQSRSGNFDATSLTQPGGQTTASPEIHAAYIRFAGFTFGRARWNFVHGPEYLFYAAGQSGGSRARAVQLAYTAAPGYGLLATLALEDRDDFASQRATPWTVTRYLSGAAGGPGFAALPWTGIQPNRLPNLVLAVSYDRDWGYVRVSAAAGRNAPVFAANSGALALHKASRTGWAIGAAAKFKLPALAQGDTLQGDTLQGDTLQIFTAYADGLIDYATGSTMNGSLERDGRLTGGYVPPHTNLSVFACALGAANAIIRVCTETTRAFSARIALTHHWTASLRSNFALSYTARMPGRAARNADWFTQGGQPKSRAWLGAANLIWSPTMDFDIGMEISFTRIRHKLACASPQASAPGYTCTAWGSAAAPSTIGVSRNPDDIALRLRVERSF